MNDKPLTDATAKFLQKEYARYHISPQSLKIGDKMVVIPCFYVRSAVTPEDIKKNFIRDYLGQQYREFEKYKEAGIKPGKISFEGGTYVVPFKDYGKNRKDADMVAEILDKAYKDYQRAVAYTKKMNDIGKPRLVQLGPDNMEAMEEEYNRYLLDKAKEQAAKLGSMVSKKVKNNFGDFFSTAKKVIIGASLTTLTAIAGLYGHKQGQEKQKENEGDKLEQQVQAQSLPKDDNKTVDYQEATAQLKAAPRQDVAKSAVKKKVSEIQEKSSVSTSHVSAKLRKECGLDDEKFQRFMGVVFEHEGGYRNVKRDYETQMGITNITLKAFWKNHTALAKEAKMPEVSKIKDLKKEQCELIYKLDFYDYYKIGDFKNESIGLLIFDIRVNHAYGTGSKIIKNGIYQARGRKNVTLPSEVLALANGIADKPKNEQHFYEHMLKARKEFIEARHHKKGKKSADYQGLMNRSDKFKGKFVPSEKQDAKKNIMLAMNKAAGR